MDFDLDGNETAIALGTQAQTIRRVNTLGWTLATNEFDGTITRTSYDALGHATDVRVSGLNTHTDYDGFGRVARQVNPDGSTIVFSSEVPQGGISAISPDGTNLLTSARTTKVWDVG